MNQLSQLAAIVLGVAAAASLLLGVAVYRYAARRAEITVLLFMFGALTLNLAALSADNVLLAANHQELRLHYILLACANMLRVLFFMLGAIFEALTFAAIIHHVPGQENTAGKNGSRIRYGYLGFVFLAAALELAAYAKTLIMHLKTRDSRSFQDDWFWRVVVMYGWVMLWQVMQLFILWALYRRRTASSPGWKFPPFVQFWTGVSYESSENAGPWRGGWTVLDLSSSTARSAPPRWLWNQQSERKAFIALWHVSALLIGLCILGLQLTLWGGIYAAVWTLAFQLLPLALLFPLVYYKTQFVFFDVLIKRGLLLVAVLGSSSIFLALHRFRLPREIVCLAAAGFDLLWAFIYRRVERAFDKYVFRRPDYGRLLVEFGKSATRCNDPRSLLERACDLLQSALGTEFVRFQEGEYSPSALLSTDRQPPSMDVAVRRDGEVYGHLLLGSRNKGQLFQSEELRFLHGVTSRISAALEQFELQRRQHELAEQAVRSELKTLRAQINPQFLFNTLDTLSGLVHSNPPGAERVTMNLARIFEFTLEATRCDQVLLGQEADFMRSYLEIEHARLEHRLQYRIDIPEELRSVAVPPMLVQPLVNHAVKHGIAQKPGGGCVTVQARRANQKLCISVENSGMGSDHDQAHELEDVRRRVEHLPGPGQWHVHSEPGTGTRISFEFEIPQGEESSAIGRSL